MKTTLLTAVLLIILAGCASTPSAIRSLGPKGVATVSVNYIDVANCMVEKMDDAIGMQNRLKINQQKKIAVITSYQSYVLTHMDVVTDIKDVDNETEVQIYISNNILFPSGIRSKMGVVISECESELNKK